MAAEAIHHKVEEVIIDIEEMIQGCRDELLLPEFYIYRVPTALRHLKEEAYTPQVVSIGPFHHGNERLQNMERQKQICFQNITQIVSNWHDLVPFVLNLEPKVRASYSETFNLTQQQLVKLILVDAFFIIFLFISNWKLNVDISAQQWLVHSIREDLLLIENQLPFFVIEELFNEVFPQNQDGRRGPSTFVDLDSSCLELAYAYFGYYNTQELKPNPNVKIKHFTDLLRLFHLHEKMPPRIPYLKELGSHILLYNANALQEAGIKLKPTKGKCLLDLKFSGHNTLEIPQIIVEDCTQLVFRNVIAFERFHYPHEAYITDYAFVLDRLIDTYEDVDLLVDKKIVRHYLGDSHNVASLFNGLWVNVGKSEFNSEYIDICQRLNSFCQDPWNRRKATLRLDYCNTPWHTVASIAGIIVLVLTIVQTILSFLQVISK